MDTEEVEVSSRKTWRKHEEDALLKCMMNELNEHGDKWKAENGFRSGFFTVVKKELDKILPGNNIKVSPHIESKVKYWRQTYSKIVDITSLSGIGWDYTNNRINVDDRNVWEAYEKANTKKAASMNGKTFPYYNDWCILFGKDRATGQGSHDASEVDNLVDMTESSTMCNDFYTALFEDEFEGVGSVPTASPMTPTPTPRTSTTPTPPSSASPTFTHPASAQPGPTPHGSLPTSTPRSNTPPANAGPKKGRKRSRMGDDEVSIYASMEAWMKESSSFVREMANKMGYEKELSGLRQGVALELEKLDLTEAEQFKLGAIICAAEERIDNFYGQRPERKQAWVEAVLRGDIY